MARRIEVSDPDDPRINVYVGLRDHSLRREREKPGGDMAGFFMAEGDVVVERALRAGNELHSILIDGTRRTPVPAAIGNEVPVFAASPGVLEHVTGYHLHRGMIACFWRPPVTPVDEVVSQCRSVVVGENLNNPTNLGLILRAAAGLGIDGLLLDPTSCDPLYRRAGRVSMGEAYALAWSWLEPFPDGLAPLRNAGFTIVALTPADDAIDIGELRLGADQRVALLLGAEGPGLSAPTMAAADVRVRIPMAGGVDSLNVGSAAAVAFYALRQARNRSAQSA